MRSASNLRPCAKSWLLVAFAASVIATPTRAAEYFVNNSSPSCSSNGPGTLEQPYCTISAALLARHTPGTIITVLPGHYREQITVSWSGSSGSPITLRAQPGPTPVIVDAADDFSAPGAWTQFFGDVWLAASVTWSPKQVFADDARLIASTAEPMFLPPNSYRYIAGTGLYVNAGGGDPGEHATQVGRRLYGFFMSSRSWIRVEGFQVQRAEERCIQVNNSSNIQIVGNRLRSAGKYGLQANADSAVTISSNVVWDAQGHGIALTAFTAASLVENNESYGNADPAIRTANGLHLFSSPRNVIRNNRWHHNQDSGQQLSPGSHDNFSVGNVSYLNGDHGFDHVGSHDTEHTNEVAWGNYNDGFSMEGGSFETEIHNSISVENGATTNRFNLFVDSLSTAGFESGDNVYWNSTPRPPVRFANSVYASVAAFHAARDHDERTLQEDPLFASPITGNFHLQAHSPAIDNANSSVSEWPTSDSEGLSRSDDPGMPDIGLGPVTFADRGAFEFQGSSASSGLPPVVQFKLSPDSGAAPLLVRADATGSVDPEGGALMYTFDLGDGTVIGPQSWPFTDHLYAAGDRVVQVTVTDAGGASVTVTANLEVTTPSANAVLDPSFEAGIAGWAPLGNAALQHVTGGHTGSKALRVSAPPVQGTGYGITDAPRWVPHAPFLGAQYHIQAWVRSALGTGHAVLRVRETHDGTSGPWTATPRLLLGSAWALLQMDYTTMFPGTRLAVEFMNQAGIGSAMDVDDVSIEYLAGTGEPEPRQGPTPGASDFAPRLQPNPMGPAGGTFRMSTRKPGALTVHIYDLAGRRVREISSAANSTQHVLRFDGYGSDGTRLALGIYHYQVWSPDGVHKGRLVLLP